MNTSPPSKRTKLDPLSFPSPSPNGQNPEDTENNDDPDPDSLEREHCAICLQPYIDRAIIPTCAHEFCFECILLWSEQSRKCPLCSRSFDDSYLIHHIRSQYDYQKHYLPPLRSSPQPPLTAVSRVNALRNTRRERQWGRRQRREREEADQLERAIARRRWIYHHHIYAKHVASNPYTRYRPFPTPAQFTASPDLISRMTTFLRRELRVWLNLDVEFLTTYTISLMKSIDIRSESAVKLLSEFLDLDTPYTPGARQVNSEHFAHEIYCYLRSPYRDLNMYDQMAQYDTPPDMSPPQGIESGSRWSTEPLPSRRSCSRPSQPSTPHRGNTPVPARHNGDTSVEARREARPNRRHSLGCSPRSIPPDRDSHDSHIHVDGIEHNLRNENPQTEEISRLEPSSSTALAENKGINFLIQPHFRSNEKGKGRVTEVAAELDPLADNPEMDARRVGDPATALAITEAGPTRTINGPSERTGGEVADYVDNVCGASGSSANPPLSRKRLAGIQSYPRNRTLSESVQAYLSKPAAPWRPSKKHAAPGDERSTQASEDTTATGAQPRHFLRLTDGLAGPDAGNLASSRTTTANKSISTRNDDRASEQQHPGYRSHSCPSATIIGHGDHVGDNEERRILPTAHRRDGGFASAPASADRSPGYFEFPHVPSGEPRTRDANAASLCPSSATEGSRVDRQCGESRGRLETPMGRDQRGNDVLGLRSHLLGWRTSASGGLVASREDRDHGYADATVVPPEKTMYTSDSTPDSTSTTPSKSTPKSAQTGRSDWTIPDPSALETKLRARARLHVRLAAMKGTTGGGAFAPGAGSSADNACRRGAAVVPPLSQASNRDERGDGGGGTQR